MIVVKIADPQTLDVLKEACPDIPKNSQKMLVSQEKFEISDHSKNLRNDVSGPQEHSLKFWAKSIFQKKTFF